MTRLYLGTHEVSWLTKPGMPPLFISANRLAGRKRLPNAVGPWALDSGGFTELRDHGTWRTDARQYAALVRRLHDEIGGMEWAAPQDWMCEPAIINGGLIDGQRFVGTHLSVAEHQRRTVANGLELRHIDADLPWVYVVQGDKLADYLRCCDLYEQAGVDLTRERVVGVGSVCRRQATGEITTIVATLAGLGIRLHGFGVKTLGLRKYADYLVSADSLAWSYGARRAAIDGVRPGCTHRSCANCARYALTWHQKLQRELDAMPCSLWSLDVAS